MAELNIPPLVPVDPPPPLDPSVDLNPPMVGRASPFVRVDAQNRDAVLESIRAWARVNLLTWSAAWQDALVAHIAGSAEHLNDWQTAAQNYITANAIQGPRGIPGPNTVPTDTAVAGNVSDPATLTHQAIAATFGAGLKDAADLTAVYAMIQAGTVVDGDWLSIRSWTVTGGTAPTIPPAGAGRSAPAFFKPVQQQIWQYRLTPTPRLHPLNPGADFELSRDAWFVIGSTEPTKFNTGIYTTPVPRELVEGTVTLNNPGSAFRNKTVTGRIIRAADDLLIENVDGVVSSTAGPVFIDCRNSFLRTTIQDVTIRSAIPSLNWTAAVRGNDFIIQRSQIIGFIDLIKADARGVTADAPANVRILGNYLDELSYLSPDPSQPTDDATHNDLVQITSGWDIDVIGNTLKADLGMVTVGPGGHTDGGKYGQGVTLTPTNGPIRRVKVDLNWFKGGVHPFIAEGAVAAFNDVTVTRNRFDRTTRVDPDNPNPMTEVRPIIARPGFIQGFPAVTGPDTNGNVYADNGQPVTIFMRGV